MIIQREEQHFADGFAIMVVAAECALRVIPFQVFVIIFLRIIKFLVSDTEFLTESGYDNVFDRFIFKFFDEFNFDITSATCISRGRFDAFETLADIAAPAIDSVFINHGLLCFLAHCFVLSCSSTVLLKV